MDSGRTGLWICLAIVVLATISDLASRRIPNVLTFSGIVLGLALHAALGYVHEGAMGALRGAGIATMGILVASTVPLFGFVRGEMGGGDVKLFAAIGALCGPIWGFDVQGLSFAVLLVIVLPWRLVRHGVLRASLANGSLMIAKALGMRRSRVPYAPVKLPPVVMGPSILAGFCLSLLHHGSFG